MRYTIRAMLVLTVIAAIGLYIYLSGPWWRSWQRLQALSEFRTIEAAILSKQRESANELDANYLQGRTGATTTLRLLDGIGWTNNVVLGTESNEREYGTFARNDTQLTFVVDVPNFEGTGWGPLHIIRWGERIYLVSQEMLYHFEKDCQRGVEPRTTPLGMYYLREGDHLKPVSGDPVWPEGIAREPAPLKRQP